MAQSNEIKIIIGGDAAAFKKAATEVASSAETIESAMQGAASASQAAAASVKNSFDAMAASRAAIDRLNASIDAAADAALKAGPKFDSLGGRFPLADMNAFRASIQTLKNDLKGGFSPKFEAGFSKISLGAGAAEVSLSKLKPGANQAAAALTNVGRVAQDLPFGFIGIQNNLNPLLESFQRLKAETGSSKAALSALGQSLIGAGGIGLALSVVSSAILIYQNGIAGFNSKTKEAKDKADEFAKSIRSIALVQQEAAAGVEGQISQVAALANVVSDSNKPYEQRKRALQELKEINKAYFGDLKLEDAATGALAKTVDEYTKALINNAIQKGFVDEIASVAKAVAKQDDVLTKSRLKLAQAQKAVRDADNFLPTATRDPETAKQKKREAAGLKEAEALAEVRIESEKVTQLLVQEALVRDQLNKAVSEGLKFKDLQTETGKKEEDALKKRLEALEKIQAATKDATTRVGLQEAIFELQTKITIRDAGKNSLSKTEVDQAIQGFQKELQKEFDNQAIELELSPKARFSEVVRANISNKNIESEIAKATGLDKKITLPTQFDIDLEFNGRAFAESAERARAQVAGIQQALLQAIVRGMEEGSAIVGEAFANIFNGDSIGSALAKAAQGLLGIVGGILQDVGKQIIEMSALVAALKRAISVLFTPGGEAIAFGIGLALVAAGALLKSIKFDVPKLADGGIATRATLGIFGEAGREAIIPLNKLPEMVGKLSTDNQQAIIINGNLRVDGTDLSLMLERVSGRRSRLG